MKTLTILFESPNVFKVLPEWPIKSEYFNERGFIYDHITPHDAFERARDKSKDNAIIIDNIDLLNRFKSNKRIGVGLSINDEWLLIEQDKPNRILKHGDIFQVEGFEYEISGKCCIGIPHLYTCGLCKDFEKLAILKLAKEEEPKYQNWYTENEMYHWLIRENYSEQIAKELSKKWANDLQGAFNKGFEKAKLPVTKIINRYKEGMSEYFRMHDHRIMYGLFENMVEEIEKLKK